MQSEDSGILQLEINLKWWRSQTRDLKVPLKKCSHPSDCINRNRLQREKLELELPRMPCIHLQKPLTISKSGLQNLGSVPSGKLSSWAGQEGALASCHVRSNDRQISEESRVHTTPLEFNKNIKWKWFPWSPLLLYFSFEIRSVILVPSAGPFTAF